MEKNYRGSERIPILGSKRSYEAYEKLVTINAVFTTTLFCSYFQHFKERQEKDILRLSNCQT